MRLQTAGHEQRANNPATHTSGINQKLLNLCKEYLDAWFDNIWLKEHARKSWERQFAAFGLSVPEINSLLLHPDIAAKGLAEKGHLISTMHDAAAEKVIIYDLDVPITDLGFESKKLFINKGYVAGRYCQNATGAFVNLGTCGESAAPWAKLMVTTNAPVYYSSAEQPKLIVSYERMENIAIGQNTVLAVFDQDQSATVNAESYRNAKFLQKEKLPALKTYTDRLIANCAKDVEEITQEYGQDPAPKILADVADILGYAPWEAK